MLAVCWLAAGPASRVPPTEAARSRMPGSPCPPPLLSAAAGEPRPLSAISMVRSVPVKLSDTVADAGPACRMALVSDSCTIR
jgi:hypothetical protein